MRNRKSAALRILPCGQNSAQKLTSSDLHSARPGWLAFCSLETRILHSALLATSMGWTTTRGALKGKSKIPVSKRDKTGVPVFISQTTAKLVEIGSSLIFAKNSGRKFQTHISNSGEQIPKHARQNSEDCRFPVSRNKVRSRGHRFLGTYFSILVFLSSNSRPGLEFGTPHISHFSILDANPRTPTAWRSHNSSF